MLVVAFDVDERDEAQKERIQRADRRGSDCVRPFAWTIRAVLFLRARSDAAGSFRQTGVARRQNPGPDQVAVLRPRNPEDQQQKRKKAQQSRHERARDPAKPKDRVKRRGLFAVERRGEDSRRRHSARSASSGLTRVARHAGKNAAASAARARAPTETR